MKEVNALAMLHILFPITHILITIGIFKRAFTVTHIILPLTVVFATVIPDQRAFTVFLIVFPRTDVFGTVLPNVSTLTFTLVIYPIASVIVVHSTFAMLVILIPHTVITVIIHKIIDTSAVLLVLKPLTVILFTVGKSVNAIPFTLSFNVLAFIDITVFKYRLSLSVGFASFHFTGIYGTILKRMRPYFYFRRESSLYFIEEAAFFLGCDTAL